MSFGNRFFASFAAQLDDIAPNLAEPVWVRRGRLIGFFLVVALKIAFYAACTLAAIRYLGQSG